jgi:hypothetical protein
MPSVSSWQMQDAPGVSRARIVALTALGTTLLATLAAVLLALGASSETETAEALGSVPVRAQGDRAPPSEQREARALEIAWVGDTMLGSRHGIPPDRGRPVLAGVRGELRSADLTIGNLEGTFGTGGSAKCPIGTPNCFAFQAPPDHAQTLAWAGFDVMNLANNHAFDYGEQGLAETQAALKKTGVAYTGLPNRVVRVERHGRTVAVIGFAPYPWAQDLLDLPAARALVQQAARTADIVIVTMHIGSEGSDQTHTPATAETYLGEPRGDSRAFAHAVIEAGADLVVGSGPHVPRGLERHNGQLIAYSTGNFAGYHTFSTAGELGMSAILRVTLDGHGTPLRGRWQSVRIVGSGTPQIDPSGASAALAAQMSREDFGRGAVPPGPDGRLLLDD